MRGSIEAVLDPALAGLGQPLEAEQAALRADDDASRLALQYLSTCLDGDVVGAARALLSAGDDGMTPHDLYCRVLMPAQREVGRLWHRGDLNVAEERLVTETTRRVMAQLSARYEPALKSKEKVLSAAVAGNTHDLGLRAATDLFALAGWHCFYLGADVPARDIALMVEKHGIELVLLAATLETHLGATAEAIAELKLASPSCLTLIGGMDFGDGDKLLRRLGADAYCRRLDDVVAVGEQLLRDRGR
jgi:methanogenic corrinoid protein MtbC1